MQLQLYGKKIWLFRKAVDFRRSIDGLLSVISQESQYKVSDGIYLFYNKDRNKVKCLSWHKNGYILLYKRLERGRFYFTEDSKTGAIEMSIDELSWLLAGLDWQTMRQWGELSYDKFS